MMNGIMKGAVIASCVTSMIGAAALNGVTRVCVLHGNGVGSDRLLSFTMS